MTLSVKQLDLRKGRIGASQVAAIVGKSRFGGPHDVYAEVLGLPREDEAANDSAEIEAVDVGHVLEGPVARELYARPRGLQLVPGVTLLHPEKDFMLATPDFGVPKPGLANPTKLRCTTAAMWRDRVLRNVEVKVVGRRMADDWTDAPDGVPDYYLTQVTWQMLVTGVLETDVVALLGGTDFRVYRISYNARLGAALETVVERWYRRHIVERVPPAPDGSDAAGRLLDQFYPRNVGEVRCADILADIAARELREAREGFDKAKKAKALAEQRMQQLIADSEGIKGGDWKATWKYQGPTEVKAFTRKGGRVFRFTVKGDD